MVDPISTRTAEEFPYTSACIISPRNACPFIPRQSALWTAEEQEHSSTRYNSRKEKLRDRFLSRSRSHRCPKQPGQEPHLLTVMSKTLRRTTTHVRASHLYHDDDDDSRISEKRSTCLPRETHRLAQTLLADARRPSLDNPENEALPRHIFFCFSSSHSQITILVVTYE